MSTAAIQPRAMRRARGASNTKLAMALFLFTEAMVFCGLISSYLVLRGQTLEWPPAGQPRLPLMVTALNTLVLGASGWSMWQTLNAVRAGQGRRCRRLLITTLLLGGLFVVIQGAEWIKLIEHGLTVSSSIYGSIFYTIVGCHALHVMVALVVVAVVTWRLQRARHDSERADGLIAARMYWSFVVAVWPPLYIMVYLW